MVQVVENNGLYLNATEKVYINGITIDGGRTTVSPNAKTLIDCKDLVIKNAEVKNGCVAYNIIEQPQNAKFPTESIYIDNLKAPNTIIHNVVSYYNFADNAEILIENAEFDLNVATSNVIRLSNYTNVDNVTVTLRNVKWTYETVGGSEEDFQWAGLIIFQPAGADAALQGDYSHIKTWKFVFENCYYNGTKVEDNGFGTHAQVLYLYNLSNDKATSDPKDIDLQMEFK